jgi:gluconolactonase
VDSRGELEWLTQDPISPNDLCFGPDGFLYVTDPTRHALDDGRIWRCDVASGEAELLVSVHWYPNGIGFGLEPDALYVADTRNLRIMRFPFSAAGLGKPEIFAQMRRGRPDGFAFDMAGNLTVCCVSNDDLPGDVQTFTPQGQLLEVICPGTGKRYTNIAIASDRRAAITDADAGAVLLSQEWPTAGLLLHPFRASAPSSTTVSPGAPVSA